MVRLPYKKNEAFSGTTFPHFAVGFISIIFTLALIEYPLFRLLERPANHQAAGRNKALSSVAVPSCDVEHEPSWPASQPNPQVEIKAKGRD